MHVLMSEDLLCVFMCFLRKNKSSVFCHNADTICESCLQSKCMTRNLFTDVRLLSMQICSSQVKTFLDYLCNIKVSRLLKRMYGQLYEVHLACFHPYRCPFIYSLINSFVYLFRLDC